MKMVYAENLCLIKTMNTGVKNGYETFELNYFRIWESEGSNSSKLYFMLCHHKCVSCESL